jgi:type III pantothenate kinase
MIGALERVQGSFVVIDAGTAITSDWVDADGAHKGGHIVAGEHLLQQTLLGNTGGIAWSAGHDKEAPDYANDIGQNTSAAVALGAKAMVRGYCHQVVSLIAGQLDSKGKGSQSPTLMVTGGNGDIITQWLKDSVLELGLESEVEYHPNLVLEGISYWFSLNN